MDFTKIHHLFFFSGLFAFLPSAAANNGIDCAPGECGALAGLDALLPFLDMMGVYSSDDIVAVVLSWVNLVLALMGTVAFVAFIWAGVLYITAFAGGEENIKSAKHTMTWTAIGIVVILMSYTVVSTLINARIA